MVKNPTYVPPGHFYSAIPLIDEIKQREEKIFGIVPRTLPAVDLSEEEQLALLDEFRKYYVDQPFSDEKQTGLRYFFNNPTYSYADGLILHCMLRHNRPKRIIEVGCGYSSAAIMDTNEIFFDNQVRCTFIDPFIESVDKQRFLSIVKPGDLDKNEIIAAKLQDVDLQRFLELDVGDILHFDSTHVSKVDSDVNHIFFQILPNIRNGVYVHFHDVFYPFEYPKEWIYEGRAWNEAYLLRAFLEYNKAFKIVIFNDFLARFHRDGFGGMPFSVENAGFGKTGGSIWIKKA
jgi:hypothetical protein